MEPERDRLTRITATPAYRQVAETIERRIVAGTLRPGEPVGTEADLVKQFGVNRSTVREGIRLLEHSGLIRRDSSRRLLVGLPHYDRLATRMTRALVLQEATFRELYEAALALHATTVELATERATPELIAALDANVERTQAALDDPAAIAELDTEFHTLLGHGSNNRVLELAREPTNMLIYPTTELIMRQGGPGASRLLHAHRMIADAVRRRDVEAARLWVRRHLNDWRRGFELAGKDLDQPIDWAYLRDRRHED
jgi:GntR family transcriptional repressor for pyruvate dehydrogenase complex